jgi:hypothetical protein
MSVFIILVSGFVGTLFMTFFSYLVSNIYGSNFREPQLLNRLLAGSAIISLNIKKTSSIGWFLHYCAGWFLATVYYILVRFTEINYGWLSGLIFGLIAGITAVGIWKLMLTLNSNPPEISQTRFFIHLVMAHLIFSMGMVLIYQLLI